MERHRARRYALLCCVLAAATASAAQPAAKPAAQPAARPAAQKSCEGLGDASFFRDEGINIKVSSKLKFNKSLMRENIQTKTNGGIVTLQGYVATAEHAQLAARLASEVGGVRCVNNLLAVGASPMPDKLY